MQNYETVEDRNFPGTWRVEHVDDRSEGEVSTAIFIGPAAEARAREYATLQSRKSRAAAPPKPKAVATGEHWMSHLDRVLPGLPRRVKIALAWHYRDTIGYDVPRRDPRIRQRLRRSSDRTLLAIPRIGRRYLAHIRAVVGG